MRKERQTKVLSILALVVGIFALSVGFAAFSTVLRISSNANVNPSSENFKINIYGFKDEVSANAFTNSGIIQDSYLSNTVSYPTSYTKADPTIATINNADHTISVADVNINDVDGGIEHTLVIKNEGAYDTYMDLSDLTYEGGNYRPEIYKSGVCVAKEGATESLVQATCESVILSLKLVDMEKNEIETTDSYYMIPKGEYIIATIVVEYEDPETLADGPFSVSFADLELDFSTATTEQ